MANPQIFLISCFSLLTLTLTLTLTLALSSSIATPHNELKKYGFPIGLLPAEIESYTLNRTSGEFALYMSDTCRITLPPDNYLATYSKRITGKIVENRIAELNGISVRAFFQWWGITGIRSNGEKLTFEVGVVTANYPSKNFDETPHCEGRRRSSS